MDGDIAQRNSFRELKVLLGGLSILVGVLLLVGQLLHQQWVVLLAIPVVGLIGLGWGWRKEREIFIILGCLLFGIGAGLFFGFGTDLMRAGVKQAGILILGGGIGFILIPVLRWFRSRDYCWWPLIPAAVLLSTGLCMVVSRARLLDFVLYISLGVGVAFLVVGLTRRLLGLIIPGSIVLGSGVGVYLAWGTGMAPNALSQTGLMLVCIAFGWIMITVFSRKVTDQFIWWPLIPGGIIAMTGWGLYIGGNPGEAASFIGNTGSVGLIVLGMYLLLLRRGIKK